MGGRILEGRHSMKLMYIRKRANHEKPRNLDLENNNSQQVNSNFIIVSSIYLWTWSWVRK